MKKSIDVEMLFSKNLQNVYLCLRDCPCAASEVITKACKCGMSFSHPRQDVRRSLAILEIMGIANKKISGSSCLFELSDDILVDRANIYNISKGTDKALDELGLEWTRRPIESMRNAMKDLSDKDFGQVLDLLVKKNKIRMENGELIKNVTVYTYKKTSD